jgi:hypothetical protein
MLVTSKLAIDASTSGRSSGNFGTMKTMDIWKRQNMHCVRTIIDIQDIIIMETWVKLRTGPAIFWVLYLYVIITLPLSHFMNWSWNGFVTKNQTQLQLSDSLRYLVLKTIPGIHMLRKVLNEILDQFSTNPI